MSPAPVSLSPSRPVLHRVRGWLRQNPFLLRAATRLGHTERAREARELARRQGGELLFRWGSLCFRTGARDILFPPYDLHFALYFVEHLETFLPRLIFRPAGRRLVADCRGASEYRLPSGGRVWLPMIAEPIDFFSGYFQKGGPQTGQIAWDAGAYCGETT
ncbi:MAG: hypothetical protein ABUL68_01130, partial [Pseudomonadota bacterium]